MKTNKNASNEKTNRTPESEESQPAGVAENQPVSGDPVDGDEGKSNTPSTPSPTRELNGIQNDSPVDIPITKIVLNRDMQGRADVNKVQVNEYVEAMKRGAKFPPVIVFAQGEKYAVLDGGHRFLATKQAGRAKTLACLIIKGSIEDAVKAAVSANVTHGLPRNNADKRHAVLVALKAFPKLKNRQIARLCHVTHPFVGNVRDEMETVSTGTEGDAGQSEKKKSGPKKNGKKANSEKNAKDEENSKNEDRTDAPSGDPKPHDGDPETEAAHKADPAAVFEATWTTCQDFLLQKVYELEADKRKSFGEKLRQFAESNCS